MPSVTTPYTVASDDGNWGKLKIDISFLNALNFKILAVLQTEQILFDIRRDLFAHLQKLPLEIRVYEITGPLFFGAADAIEHIVVKDFTKCLVLRMRSVPAIDSTAMNALQNLTKLCESKGITLVFSHVNEQPMKVMKKSGFVELVGEENFCSNISDALKHAEELISR